MNFTFDGYMAKEYGVDEAIMYNYFSYWIAKNKANDKHFYDGYTWTYNSQKALSELFPFWNRAKIQRIIASLEKQGLLIKGNYNQLSYDRTTWYALPKFEQEYVQKRTNNGSKINNEQFKIEQPIPINYQLTKQLTNTKEDIVEQSTTTSQIIEYLNLKAGTNYKPSSKTTKQHINARLKEGFKLEDFKKVIDTKCDEWINDSKMKQYLRPNTLFGTKFESYLNQQQIRGNKNAEPFRVDDKGNKRDEFGLLIL